jgi:hypothetical protein
MRFRPSDDADGNYGASMKKQLRGIAVICVLLSVCVGKAYLQAPQPVSGQSAALRFTANPIKPKFKMGEPVIFEFKLKNVSKGRVLVARSIYPGFATLHLTGPDGNEVQWQGNQKILSESYSPDAFAVLRSGESGRSRRAISLEKGQGYIITAPGSYVAWAEYSLGPPEYFSPVAKGSLVPQGSFRSPATKFWVH